MWLTELLTSKAFWIAVLAAALLAATVHYKGKYDDAINKVVVMEQADEARKAADAKQALADLRNKERTDEENARTRAALERQLDGLRNSIAQQPLDLGNDPVRPDLVTFDRAEFARALQEYRLEVSGLVAEGAACIADLDSLKAWAKSRGN